MAETEDTKVMRDEESAAPKRDFIEYLGVTGPGEYGTDFLSAHTIPRGDALWKRAGLKVTKDVTWERDPMGPGHGQPGNRMLVPVEDLPEGAAEVLAKTPGYRRVSE